MLPIDLGGVKAWLGFHQRYMAKINKEIEASYPTNKRSCKNHTLHKENVFSWQFFERHGIPYFLTLQKPGEVIITLAGGFHQTMSNGLTFSEVSVI